MSLGRAVRSSLKPRTHLKVDGQFGRVNFNLFFDRTAVTSRLEKKELKVLSKTGAFGRGAMRRPIRQGRKNSSKPGKPPRYWERGAFRSLKDGIFFQADLDRGSVVIGPNKMKTAVTPIGKVSTAQLLDQGGSGVITAFRYNKPTESGQFRRPRLTQQRGRWRERPYVLQARDPTATKMLEFMKKFEL